MRTVLDMHMGNEIVLQNRYKSDDIRSSDELVSYFIINYSKVGDVIFDTFLGFGTAMIIADKLKRL